MSRDYHRMIGDGWVVRHSETNPCDRYPDDDDGSKAFRVAVECVDKFGALPIPFARYADAERATQLMNEQHPVGTMSWQEIADRWPELRRWLVTECCAF